MPERPYVELDDQGDAWDRLENMVSVRRFEGGEAFTGEFGGKPCFAVDERVLADLDEDSDGWNSAPIYVFDKVSDRDAYAAEWLKPFQQADRVQAIVYAFRVGQLTERELRVAIGSVHFQFGVGL